MIFRLILGLALIVFATGFIWFAAQVIWLGTREFFRIHGKSSSSSVDSATIEDEKISTTTNS